ELTGMPLANASLLDEATAAAEAMTLLQRVNRRNKSTRFLVDQQMAPQTLDVIINRATYFGIDVVVCDPAVAIEEDGGAGIQGPCFRKRGASCCGDGADGSILLPT
ncbi:MAG: hypothetical protein ACPG31_09190, partial [Planctomycetota bacterium]